METALSEILGGLGFTQSSGPPAPQLRGAYVNWPLYKGPADRLGVSTGSDTGFAILTIAYDERGMMWCHVGPDVIELEGYGDFDEATGQILRASLRDRQFGEALHAALPALFEDPRGKPN